MAVVGAKVGGRRSVWVAKSIGTTSNSKTANQLEQRGPDKLFWHPGKKKKLK